MIRGCPKPLSSPKAEALKPPGWEAIVEGPRACPRIVLERDQELMRWMQGHNLLHAHNAYPHSPGDWGAQGARWAEAVELIATANRQLDAEELEKAKKEKKGAPKGGRR